MYHIFLIHSSVEGHSGCFQVLAMTSNAAMNRVEHMSLWYGWASFGYIPQNGIAGSWSSLFPSFLRNLHTDFQSGCINLHFHQQWGSVPFTPHPHQHKLSSMFLILAIFYRCKMESQSCFDLEFCWLWMLNISLSVFQRF